MRYILLFWALPMGLFWGWYFLSMHDISFGLVFFSRAMHEVLFEVYGDILGIDPTLLPGMVARACVLDTAIIFAIFAFRKRRQIAAWWSERRGDAAAANGFTPLAESGRAPPAE